jgi:hypothetical protein
MVNNAGCFLLLVKVALETGNVPAAALHEAQQGHASLGDLTNGRVRVLRGENSFVQGLGLGVLPALFLFFSQLDRDLEVPGFLLRLLLEGAVGFAGQDRLDRADEAVRWPETGDAVELFTLAIDDQQGGEAADTVAFDDILSLALFGVDLDRDKVLVQQGGDVFVGVGLTDQYFAPSSPVGVEIDEDQLLAFRGLLEGAVKGAISPFDTFSGGGEEHGREQQSQRHGLPHRIEFCRMTTGIRSARRPSSFP